MLKKSQLLTAGRRTRMISRSNRRNEADYQGRRLYLVAGSFRIKHRLVFC